MTLCSKDALQDDLISKFLAGDHDPVLGFIITTLTRDKSLNSLLENHPLRYIPRIVCAAAMWAGYRKKEMEPELFSPGNVMAFLSIDSHSLPCMDQIKAYLSALPSSERVYFLVTALDQLRKDMKQTGAGAKAISNIISLMAHFADPQFVPHLTGLLLSDPGKGGHRLCRETVTALSVFKDAAFEHLDAAMENISGQLPEYVISLIQKIGTETAEDFLIRHFPLFLRKCNLETLSACQGMVSEKALALLAHKVGKNQRSVDQLFVLVMTLTGKADPRTREILDTLPEPGEDIENAMAVLNTRQDRNVMTLALECTRCGDISDYDCECILAHPGGDFYVGGELTCLSCRQISEFIPTPMARLSVSGEMLRQLYNRSQLMNQENQEEHKEASTGAVRILNTSIMGEPMSVPAGIALYREMIGKEPENPEYYIGLGNIYKAAGQVTFAENQYTKAIACSPHSIESYLSLAEMTLGKDDEETALQWLEKGRSFLKAPLICKDIQITVREIMESYFSLHEKLRHNSRRRVTPLLDSEMMDPKGKTRKIGRNEKCPCGSGKKYKKCCMGNQ